MKKVERFKRVGNQSFSIIMLMLLNSVAHAAQAPLVIINTPTEGDTFVGGTSISFAGSATDADDGDITTSIVWSVQKKVDDSDPLVGHTVWSKDFSTVANTTLPEDIGFVGINAAKAGWDALPNPYFKIESGKMVLTSTNIKYGFSNTNFIDSIRFGGTRLYDSASAFRSSYTFSSTPLEGEDFLLGVGDELGNQMGLRIYTTAGTGDHAYTNIESCSGCAESEHWQFYRSSGETYKIDVLVENNEMSLVFYRVEADNSLTLLAPLETATVTLSAAWGNSLHSIIEMSGTNDQPFYIEKIEEEGDLLQAPYQNVTEGMGYTPTYFKHSFFDASEAGNNYNYNDYTMGEVAPNSNDGFGYFSVEEVDVNGQLQKVLKVTNADLDYGSKIQRITGTQSYLINESLPYKASYQVHGNASLRAFFGITNGSKTLGIKLVGDDAYASAGVFNVDYGSMTRNRTAAEIWNIDIEVHGREFLIYYYRDDMSKTLAYREDLDLSVWGSSISSVIETRGSKYYDYNYQLNVLSAVESGTSVDWVAVVARESSPVQSLPVGGSITGIMTDGGIYQVIAQVTDSDGMNAQDSVEIVVTENPDLDGDGISNEYEILVGTNPNDPTSTPPDMDGDGVPDSIDPDQDGDGVDNEVDACPTDSTETSDQDGDGICDNSDTDRDGDGSSNSYEISVGTNPDDGDNFPAPVIVDFSVTKSSLDSPGEQVGLSWQCLGGLSISISNNITSTLLSDLASTGSVTMSPNITTKYTLTVVGPGDQLSAEIVVSVDVEEVVGLWGKASGIDDVEQVKTSITVTESGVGYVGSFDGDFHKVSSNGDVEWTYENAGVVMGKSIIVDSLVIFGANGNDLARGRVYALTTDMEENWIFETESSVIATPLVDEGKLFVVTYDGVIHVIDLEGVELMQYSLPEGAQVTATPTLSSSKQTLIIKTSDDKIYAVDVTELGVDITDRIKWKRE